MITEMTAQQPTMRPDPGDFNCCYGRQSLQCMKVVKKANQKLIPFSHRCIVLLMFLILILIILFTFLTHFISPVFSTFQILSL